MEEHHSEHSSHKKKKVSIWKIISSILAILLLISIFTSGFSSLISLSKGVSQEKAKERVSNFLTNNLLPGTPASVTSIEDMGGIYKLEIEVEGNTYPSYLTKDAKLLFPSAIDLTEIIEPVDTTDTITIEEIPKTDKPKIELFVMSFCPYGNRAEDTMLPVYNLLKNKVDWNIHYIVNLNGDQINSLHGQPEVDQDEREVCVLKESGIDAWWIFTTYVNSNCGSDGACWKDAAKEAKLDNSKIENCIKNNGLNLMKAEEEATNLAGASGSPTLIINGVGSKAVYQYGNSEVYKQAICSAFNTPPQECSEILTSNAQTSTGGSC